MGNRFLISLLLLLPVLSYGYFLLNREFTYLPNPFQDEWLYRRQKIYKNRAINNHPSSSPARLLMHNGFLKGESYQSVLVVSFLGLIVILILTQANPVTIASLIFTLVTYLCWERTATGREIENQKKSIESELPAMAEVFSILISAGVSPSTAFEWLAGRAHGELGDRVRYIVAECRDGALLVHTLDAISQELASALVRRFVDSIAISLERGSSLAEQLRLYVGEMRVQERRKLMEKAGKAEIGLMIPVVFLILPISVVFALWPSYQSLSGFLLH
jgi:pilus assembly protein TadC